MIEYILNALNTREEKSQEDYITALAAFRGGGALEEEEAEKLAGIYEKYSRDAAHPELARLYMALDMLPGRSREDAAVFLGDDGKCLGGLAALLRELAEAGCAMGPWRV